MSDLIPLSVPCISGNEWKYVKDCLDTGWVSSVGSYVNRFESEIARYAGSPYAVATVNGTAALHMALLLLGVEACDEVIVPTLTFIAPVNAVRYVNANPVFMDCDDYLNIDAEKFLEFCDKECSFNGEHLINNSTKAKIKAIIIVHVFGHPVEIQPIKDAAEKYNLKIIEDATESLGSFYKSGKFKGLKTGTIGDIGCYSFNGNKIITTGGGGMIVTHSEKLAEKARYYTTQAKDDPETFVHDKIGYNYRLTNVQAAIGCAQLEKLDQYIKIKRENFNKYLECLKGIDGLSFVMEPDYGFSNYWHYTLAVGSDVLKLRQRLRAEQIETRPVWELNHRQKPYKGFQNYKIEKAVIYHKMCLNLPCSVNLSHSDIIKVAEAIKK